MLKALIDWIGRKLRSPREPYHARPDGLLRLDLSQLRENLQPAAKGQAAGRANLPPTGAATPDARELEILRACQDAADKAFKHTKANCEALLVSIEQLSPSKQAAQIDIVRSSVISAIRTTMARMVDDVRRQSQLCAELAHSFAEFKVRNRLSRPASYPSSKTLWIGALFAMVVIEGALNGILFAEGSAQGLIGGFGQALVFAVVNVVLGFLAGRIPVRFLTHRLLVLKFFAAAGLLAYVGASVGLNLAVAHFRDLAQVSDDQTGAAAFQSLLQNPFALKDLVSWLLLGMGVLFSAIACFDGFKFDDPYPGYGRRHRELAVARDQLSDLCDDALTEIARIREQGARQINAASQNASLFIQQRVVYASRLARFGSDYEQHLTAVRDAFRVLIEEYRDSNRSTRTDPAPAYFAELPRIELDARPDLPGLPDPQDISAICKDAIAQIDRVHAEALERLQQLSQEAA